MGIDLYNDTYDKFCALIDKKNPEILEVAWGPGNVTKYLYSKRIDFKILGIDLAPSMIELAKINIPKADFSKLLKPEGVLYFSTMEDDYDKSGFETTSFSGQDRVYIYYHQADFLTECLISSGLNIIDFQRKECPEPDGTFFTDMIFIARKNNN